MDSDFGIKVSNFGLSEDVQKKNYFRLDSCSGVELHAKWMAPESLRDGHFSEKSDVVMVHQQILCHNVTSQFKNA